MGRACGTLGPIARSKPVQAVGPTPKHNLGSRDSAWVRDGELVPLLHPNSGARSRVSDAARDTRPRVLFPEVRLSLAVRLRRMRPIEDLSRRRLLSASRCPRVRRVFARATGGPAALLGMVVLLLVALSLARGTPPGAGPTGVRRPTSVAASFVGFPGTALDGAVGRDPGAVDESRGPDEPSLGRRRPKGVGRHLSMVGPALHREGRHQPRVGHRPGASVHRRRCPGPGRP